MERHWDQGSADKADVRQLCEGNQHVWGGEHKEQGGKQNAGNTGEHKVEIDEAQEVTATKYS